MFQARFTLHSRQTNAPAILTTNMNTGNGYN